MDLGGYTATGPRSANEDNFYYLDFSDVDSFSNGIHSFAMVSDGMGGYQGGDVASGLAVSCAKSYLSQLMEIAKGNKIEFDVVTALNEIVTNAHDAIVAESRALGKSSMGATFVGVFLSDTHAWIGHVGDSRAYLLQGDQAIQLTEDHSQVGRMLSQGLITEQEAQNHPARNRIERALGFTDTPPDITEIDLAPGDALLLCSDGVYTVLDTYDLCAAAAKASTAEKAAERVVKAALSSGTDDNSTAVIIMESSVVRPQAIGRRRPQTVAHGTSYTQHARQRPARHQGASRGRQAQHARTRQRQGQGQRQRQHVGKNRTLIIPLILAVVLAVAVGFLVINALNQSNSIENPGEITSMQNRAGSQASSSGALSQGSSTGSATQGNGGASNSLASNGMSSFTIGSQTPLLYVDQGGQAQNFTDEPLNLEGTFELRSDTSVTASENTSDYGRVDHRYRTLDETYLNALKEDCNRSRMGDLNYVFPLRPMMDDSQYRQLVNLLAQDGRDGQISHLVVRESDLIDQTGRQNNRAVIPDAETD